MNYFSNFSRNDRATFEGCEVTHFRPVFENGKKEVSHYKLSVVQDNGDIVLRQFRKDEIGRLIDSERLVMDYGY